VQKYDLSTELDTIKEKLLEWGGFLIPTGNNKNADKVMSSGRF
jgi:hypothetical protein